MSVNPGFGGQSFIASQLKQDRGDPQADRRDRASRSTSRSTAASTGTTARRAIEAGADVLVAGTATFRGGPDAYADNIRGAARGEPPRAGGERDGRGRDRAGQEADPGRRRPRPLAVRAAQLPAPPPRLADAAARVAAARPGAAEADRRAQGSDRRRQGGGRGAARRHLPPRRHRGRGRRASISRTIGLPADFSDYLQSFAWLRDLSAAATRERGAQARRGDHAQMARRPCRAGQRAGLARRPVGPAHPVLDRLCALHPVERRPGLSLRRCSTRSPAARAISSAAPTRRRPACRGSPPGAG